MADPEGHVWSFTQQLREMSVEDLEAAMRGLKVQIGR